MEESSTSLTPDVQSQLRGQHPTFRSLLPTPPLPGQQYTSWPQAGAAPAPVAQPWAAPTLPQAQAVAQQVRVAPASPHAPRACSDAFRWCLEQQSLT